VNTDERHIEAAEAAVMLEQQGEVARIHRALLEPGEIDCIDCGQPIGAKRRNAMPSAKRCIGCQAKFEQRDHRGY
jgi:phage/conjugal plasmid C-4 type zinc finger TraR family protein